MHKHLQMLALPITDFTQKKRMEPLPPKVFTAGEF